MLALVNGNGIDDDVVSREKNEFGTRKCERPNRQFQIMRSRTGAKLNDRVDVEISDSAIGFKHHLRKPARTRRPPRAESVEETPGDLKMDFEVIEG
jgi:hypothetical protein